MVAVLSLLSLAILSPAALASLREFKASRNSSSLLASYRAASPSERKIDAKTTFYKAGKKSAGGVADWRSIAGSEDMSKVVAIQVDSMFVTADSGKIWTQCGPRTTTYTDVAVSLSGQFMAATIASEPIYLSSDFGKKWGKLATPKEDWVAITMSGSGSSMAAVTGGHMQWGSDRTGSIYISNDYGVTWKKTGPKDDQVWTDITASKDFKYLAACVYNDGLYVSSDSGVNWKRISNNERFVSITSSYDGSMIAAVTNNGYTYISSDHGSKFVTRGMYKHWSSVASSKDGKTLVATMKGSYEDINWETQRQSKGFMYLSNDAGASWEKIALGVDDVAWQNAAISANGKQIWAVATNDYIYASDVNRTADVSASCFAATEMVQLASGSDLAIDKVRVGDKVLAYDRSKGFLYSHVVAVPHGENSVEAEFILVSTASGNDLKLTSKHLIGVTEGCGMPSGESPSFTLIRAEEVRLGHCLLTVNGMAAVTDVRRTKGQGLYTIVTEAEFVVVNGIVASPFAVSHGVASLLYSGHRFLWGLFPGLLSTAFFTKSLTFLGEVMIALSY